MTENTQQKPAKGSPEEKVAMLAWLTEVAGELDLDGSLVDATVGDVLKLTSTVAHDRSRPAAPVTAFLIGLAAGRQAGPDATDEELAAAARTLVSQVRERAARPAE